MVKHSFSQLHCQKVLNCDSSPIKRQALAASGSSNAGKKDGKTPTKKPERQSTRGGDVPGQLQGNLAHKK